MRPVAALLLSGRTELPIRRGRGGHPAGISAQIRWPAAAGQPGPLADTAQEEYRQGQHAPITRLCIDSAGPYATDTQLRAIPPELQVFTACRSQGLWACLLVGYFSLHVRTCCSGRLLGDRTV